MLRDNYNALVADCARRFGVKLTLVRDDPKSTDLTSRMWVGRFGTLPLAHARRYGYHAAPGGPATEPFTIFVGEDENPQVEVLTGVQDPESKTSVENGAGHPVPSSGCRGEVASMIGGDPYNVGPSDAEKLRLQSMRDKRTQHAMSEWTACMREQGYQFERIDQPVDAALGNAVDDGEREVAVADVTCTRSSRWRDTSYAIERSLQLRSVERNRESFMSGLALQRQMMRTSQQLRRER